MRQFLIKLSLFAFAFVLAMLGLYYLIPKSSHSEFLCYRDKIKLVRETPSPRIIFVSGSSLYYGLDSKRVADSLHVNVVNYGLHAGIGLRYWLDEITPLVHKGDLVVLAPEYFQFYNDNMDGSEGVFAPFLFYNNLNGLEHLNVNQMLKIIKGLPIMIGQNAYNYMIYDLCGDSK